MRKSERVSFFCVAKMNADVTNQQGLGGAEMPSRAIIANMYLHRPSWSESPVTQETDETIASEDSS
jgi:hypothetical protein